MGITVAHQPPAASIGTVAYGIGRGMARERAAERIDRQRAQDRHFAQQLQLDQLQATRRQAELDAARDFEQQQTDVAWQRNQQEIQSREQSAQRQQQQQLEREREQAMAEAMFKALPELGEKTRAHAQELLQLRFRSDLNDSERDYAIKQWEANPLSKYVPFLTQAEQQKTLEEQWKAEVVQLPDGTAWSKKGDGSWQKHVASKSAEAMEAADRKKAEAEAQKLKQAAEKQERDAKAARQKAYFDRQQALRTERMKKQVVKKPAVEGFPAEYEYIDHPRYSESEIREMLAAEFGDLVEQGAVPGSLLYSPREMGMNGGNNASPGSMAGGADIEGEMLLKMPNLGRVYLSFDDEDRTQVIRAYQAGWTEAQIFDAIREASQTQQ